MTRFGKLNGKGDAGANARPNAYEEKSHAARPAVVRFRTCLVVDFSGCDVVDEKSRFHWVDPQCPTYFIPRTTYTRDSIWS